MVERGIEMEFQPWSPIFEKCSHLREKGGVLTLRTPVGFALTPTEYACKHRNVLHHVQPCVQLYPVPRYRGTAVLEYYRGTAVVCVSGYL